MSKQETELLRDCLLFVQEVKLNHELLGYTAMDGKIAGILEKQQAILDKHINRPLLEDELVNSFGVKI